jgi:prophage DNA circulation protein
VPVLSRVFFPGGLTALIEKVEADVEDLKKHVKVLANIAQANTKAVTDLMGCIKDLTAAGKAQTGSIRALRDTIKSLHPELRE